MSLPSRTPRCGGRVRCALALSVLAACCLLGCHRGHYRQRADAEAYALIREKANAPHWNLERHWIQLDPRSRMFDPFDPDHPPMPEDDPTSHELMHYIDHKKGYPLWHVNGDTAVRENPEWREYLPVDGNGVLNMSADQAYVLALINSRDYQEQFETLYLSALDVSAERFRFDTQIFGGYDAFYTHRGDLAPGSILGPAGTRAERNQLVIGRATAANPVLQARRRFATAGEAVVGFANTFVWEFTGGDVNFASSLLNFSLVQPLLRQAGRDRELETLTIAERALLANVRQMERYRRAFFVEILTGANAGSGATRRGGFFGGSGLAGFAGVGGGGFGGVGQGVGFGGGIGGGGIGGAGGGGAGGGFAGGGGAGQVGGFMGLLQQLQNIRNQQVTIVGLRSNLTELRESLKERLRTLGDAAQPAANPGVEILRIQLQIAQAQQALLGAEGRLLSAQAAYQDSLDDYKFRLGLPPDVCVNVKDSMIDQFNLIDPGILAVQSQLTTLRARVAARNDQLLGAVTIQEIDGQMRSTLTWSDELETGLRELRKSVTRIKEVAQRLAGDSLEQTRADVKRLEEAVPERREDLLGLKEKFTQNLDRFSEYSDLDPCQESLVADIDPYVFDIERLERVPQELSEELQTLAGQFDEHDEPLAQIEAQLDELLAAEEKPAPAELYDELEATVIFAVPSRLSELSADVLDLSLVQAKARTDTIQLATIDLRWDLALQLASMYRRDWMNARAALVDSWRLIEFNADNLESSLDVVFDGDVRTAGDNPLDFNGSTGTMRAGLRFDAPFTRLLERNTYRQAQIEYQQARRSYYAFVDNVSRSLRSTLRTVDRNRVNFEENRIAVLSAIRQVVLNDQITTLQEELQQAAGATAARDVVSALADLQTAQNDFLSVWLNYEAQRMSLDLNLGTMNLDSEGYWVDPGPIDEETGLPSPEGWCGDGGEFVLPTREFRGMPQLQEGPQLQEDESSELLPPGEPREAVRPTDVDELSPTASLHLEKLRKLPPVRPVGLERIGGSKVHFASGALFTESE